jgi:hypothetical protein
MDQQAALLLAICNDIGEASYDRVVVASALCDRLNYIYKHERTYIEMKTIETRYGLDFRKMTGEEIVYEVAQNLYKGNMISAADKILGDFRRGFLGRCSLELPFLLNDTRNNKPQQAIIRTINDTDDDDNDDVESDDKEGEEEVVVTSSLRDNKSFIEKKAPSLDVGRGNYDGW